MQDAGENTTRRDEGGSERTDTLPGRDTGAGGARGQEQEQPENNNKTEDNNKKLRLAVEVILAIGNLGALILAIATQTILFFIVGMVSIVAGIWVLSTLRQQKLGIHASAAVCMIALGSGFCGATLERQFSTSSSSEKSRPTPPPAESTRSISLSPSISTPTSPSNSTTAPRGTIITPSANGTVSVGTEFRGQAAEISGELWLLSEVTGPAGHPHFQALLGNPSPRWPHKVDLIEGNWSSNIVLGRVGAQYAGLQFHVELVVANGNAAKELAAKAGGSHINASMFQQAPLNTIVKLAEVDVTRQ